MANPNEPFSMQAHIAHHVQNSYDWTLPFIGTIHLPPFLSLHALMIIIASVFLVVLFLLVYRRNQRVPSGVTNLLEVFVIFIRDEISVKCLGKEDGLKMTPFFCTMFFFILTLNVMGLIPIFSTATSNINVTGAMAIITFCLMVFGAIIKNGIGGFFRAFIPDGVPVPVLFILVPIELLGVFIKTASLTIRLFANMLAGHLAILVLLALITAGGLIASPIFFMVVFLYLLEMLVVVLQAYIFTFFSAMFIGQIHHPDH